MLTILLSGLLTMGVSWAGPECTKEPKEKWQNKEDFQKNLVTKGYKIKVFKETSGNCYEIYGWDSAGKKVEIYYNPVTAEVVKERIQK